MGGRAWCCVVRRVAGLVDVAASWDRATAVHWLAGAAGSVSAGCSAGCPAAGLSCFQGRWCEFCHVLHASSELHSGGEVCYVVLIVLYANNNAIKQYSV